MKPLAIAPPSRHLFSQQPDLGVQIIISRDSKIIWVNVDAVCVLRICQIPRLELTDNRPRETDSKARRIRDGGW